MATAAAGGKKKNRAKAAASKVGKVLTMPETLAKLDRVMIFHIFKLCDDGSKDVCPSLNGEVTFYVDAAEVRAEVEALKATDAALQVGIDHVPLSRAFALTQGLMGLQAPGAIQMKLQFSKTITAAEGGAGIPEALREKMSGRGPFPMFYSDKIVVPNCQPIFFTRSDLAECAPQRPSHAARSCSRLAPPRPLLTGSGSALAAHPTRCRSRSSPTCAS